MQTILKCLFLTLFLGFSQTPMNAIVAFHSQTTSLVKPQAQPKKVKIITLLRALKKYKKELDPQSRTKTEKIILYVFLTVVILAFIYFLQGSIALFIIGILAFLGIKLGKKRREETEVIIVNEKNQEPDNAKPNVENANTDVVVKPTTYVIVKPKTSEKSSKIINEKSFASRSVRSFLKGLGGLALAFILLIIGVAGVLTQSTLSSVFLVLFLVAAVAGLIFMGKAFSQSLKSISNKETDKDKAVIILVLSLLFLLPIAFILLGGLINL
jgi:hypothetical protein